MRFKVTGFKIMRFYLIFGNKNGRFMINNVLNDLHFARFHLPSNSMSKNSNIL